MGKSIETESRFMAISACGEKGMGSDCLMGMGSLLGVMKCSGIR